MTRSFLAMSLWDSKNDKNSRPNNIMKWTLAGLNEKQMLSTRVSPATTDTYMRDALNQVRQSDVTHNETLMRHNGTWMWNKK